MDFNGRNRRNLIIFIRFLAVEEERGRKKGGHVSSLCSSSPPPFLYLSSTGQRRKTLKGLFFFLLFSNKEAKRDHYTRKRMCSLKNVSRLGGEIYRNKLVSPCFANLDPDSWRRDVLSFTPQVVTMLSKTSQNGGQLKREAFRGIFSYLP